MYTVTSSITVLNVLELQVDHVDLVADAVLAVLLELGLILSLHQIASNSRLTSTTTKKSSCSNLITATRSTLDIANPRVCVTQPSWVPCKLLLGALERV